ncbi:MAG: cytochrome b, partial [Caulobacteraceae bacterium]|nr:cytochrome b [Caulobacteraceae bacterium]
MTEARPLYRYSIVAIILHWVIAVLIVLNIYQGLKMDAASGLVKFVTFQNHKSVGITILLLSLARLAWRIAHPPPPYASSLSTPEKVLSRVTHWGFYVIMIAMPLTGWLAVSASPTNLPTLLYRGWGFPGIPWPHLPVVPHLPLPQKQHVEKL